ncbi:MAG: hypothetical protein UX09_C0026G0015 [Candidatus Uhrbacteria bacterium GW2011_GWE2_45_35]|uniref:Uncharacterized protein n=2 Tax=Candidatus Uhriibacteriota TaxID=1752732 RepID=A0A0G1LS01_9BACT|nr:MAG: hypothetical protein UW63_C0012G0016 [Candidatus Uhrbacteria bacterium GW2011_GWF2_44_350]KKU07664.1 MAG: hypothetical protein UX09_C0026G0015 [Candidatus Uhrbacteria bacterium GW2011_GWE2_45_35]HBR80075.1 hypothetical protein [Candidatus Uhrbacteria bacterium]HCU31247.1 hypothetical protein [Candidatus Uhrbacteria bacterium]
MRVVLIIVNGILNDVCAHYHQLIVEQAELTEVTTVTVITNSGIVEILKQLHIEFERTFFLGEDPIPQDLEDHLLDDKWLARPMSVVAVSDSGRGALILRRAQLIKAGPNFDGGIWNKGVTSTLNRLIPSPCNA